MTPENQNPNVAGKNTRRDARELALRMLYQIEVGHQDVETVIEAAIEQSHLDEKNQTFAEQLVRGTLVHQTLIDEKVADLAVDWSLDRQAAVDRNILRLAAYELIYCLDAPVAAVVNEAVELAKKYSTSESGRFVNGVLGALARQPRGEDQLSEMNGPEEKLEALPADQDSGDAAI